MILITNLSLEKLRYLVLETVEKARETEYAQWEVMKYFDIEIEKLLHPTKQEGAMTENLDETILEIPDETPKATFGDIINYFSERIDKEIKLQLSGKDLLTPYGEKQQKHEEIKQKAWEMFLKSPDDIKIKTSLEASWIFAERFYEFAKEKEKSNE